MVLIRHNFPSIKTMPKNTTQPFKDKSVNSCFLLKLVTNVKKNIIFHVLALPKVTSLTKNMNIQSTSIKLNTYNNSDHLREAKY